MRLVSWGLLAAGLVLLTIAVPGVWIDRTVLENERFTEAVAPLIEDPGVQDALATQMSDAVLERAPLFEPARDLVTDQFARLVATDGFADTWEAAVRTSHLHSVQALRDQETGLTLSDTTLTIELAPLIGSIKPELVEAGVPFADRIPEVEGSFVLADSPELAKAATFARFMDTWATLLLGVSALLLVLGVLVAPTRWRSLGVTGLGVTLAMGVVLLGLAALRSRYLGEVPGSVASPATASAVFDSLTAPCEVPPWPSRSRGRSPPQLLWSGVCFVVRHDGPRTPRPCGRGARGPVENPVECALSRSRPASPP